MNELDSPNSFEYSYEKKATGKNLIGRVMFVILYVAFTVGAFLFCYISGFVPLFAILPMLLWILVFFTWRYVKYDIYYEFSLGTLTLGRIYTSKRGRRKRVALSIRVKDATSVCRYNDNTEKSRVRVRDFRASAASENAIAIYTAINGRPSLILSEHTDRIEKLLHSFSKNISL